MKDGEIKMLIDQLRSRKSFVREIAIKELVELNEVNNEFIVAASNNSSERIRKGVKEVIRRINFNDEVEIGKKAVGNLPYGDPKTEDALIFSLSNIDPKVRGYAINALGKRKSAKSINPMLKILCDKNESYKVRKEVIKNLGEIEDKAAEDQLLKVLYEEELQIESVIALGYIQSTKAVPHLLNLVRTDEGGIKLNDKIIGALCLINDVRAVKLLIKVLDGSLLSNYSPEEIIETLGELKDPIAIPAFLKIFKGEELDFYDKVDILKAFGKIGDSKPVEFIISLIKNPNEEFGIDLIAETLGSIGDDRAVSPLVSILNDVDELISARYSVALTLINSKWKTLSGFPSLKKNLAIYHGKRFVHGEDRKKILGWIAEADGRKLKKEWQMTKEVLLKELDSNNYRLMEEALISFMGIGNQEIIPVLIEKLDKKGNKILAEIYLNCGHSELSKAANEWAKTHGYTIDMGDGANPVSWGSWSW